MLGIQYFKTISTGRAVPERLEGEPPLLRPLLAVREDDAAVALVLLGREEGGHGLLEGAGAAGEAGVLERAVEQKKY